jgi:hypothetical protein
VSEPTSKPKDLATRVSSDTKFQIAWVLFLGVIITYIGVPIQRFLIVLWVRGSNSYFHHGIRVLRGKPVRFSDGALVPDLPDFVTGIIVFFLGIMLGLSLLLFYTLRFYERHFQKQSNNAA